MASPVGHTIFGIALVTLAYPKQKVNLWIFGFFIVLLANLPDIDYLFGVFKGDPNIYHRLWTHSLGFLFIVCILSLIFIIRLKGRSNQWIWIVTGVGALLSHLIIDYFGKDTRGICGIPVFWPASSQFFISPMAVFPEVYKGTANGNFLQGLFCVHNLWTILQEIVILGPFVILAFIWNRSSHQRAEKSL